MNSDVQELQTDREALIYSRVCFWVASLVLLSSNARRVTSALLVVARV